MTQKLHATQLTDKVTQLTGVTRLTGCIRRKKRKLSLK